MAFDILLYMIEYDCFNVLFLTTKHIIDSESNIKIQHFYAEYYNLTKIKNLF